jgi:hypothetical protein
MAGRGGGEEETVVDGGALCVSALRPRRRRGSRWKLVANDGVDFLPPSTCVSVLGRLFLEQLGC